MTTHPVDKLQGIALETSESHQNPINWRTFDVLLISLVIMIIFGIAILIIKYIYRVQPVIAQSLISSTKLTLSIAILECITIPLSIYYLGLRRRNLSWSDVHLNPIPAGWVIKIIILGALGIPLTGLVAMAIQLLRRQQYQNPQIRFLAPEDLSWLGAVSMVLLAGIAAPFVEELYFRGVLFSWLRQRWGSCIGIMISSLIFGIAHGEASIAGAAFILGIIMAWVYMSSGSLWSAILIHVINNSIKIIILYISLAFGFSN